MNRLALFYAAVGAVGWFGLWMATYVAPPAHWGMMILQCGF